MTTLVSDQKPSLGEAWHVGDEATTASIQARRNGPEDMASSGALNTLSDGELLDHVRSGIQEAYGELYCRHAAGAHRVARRLTPDRALAEDAVSEAFASILAAIQGGSGPVDVFGPYLTSSVSRAVYRMNRKSMRDTPVPDDEMLDSAVTQPLFDEAPFHDGEALIAFKELPIRWRAVLWYLDIESMHPREVGPKLGLSPNATVALHRRAKEGLRLRYLRQYVGVVGARSCQRFAADIPALTRRNLRQHRSVLVEEHLNECVGCAEARMQFEGTLITRGG